jgi:hypothetical protein
MSETLFGRNKKKTNGRKRNARPSSVEAVPVPTPFRTPQTPVVADVSRPAVQVPQTPIVPPVRASKRLLHQNTPKEKESYNDSRNFTVELAEMDGVDGLREIDDKFMSKEANLEAQKLARNLAKEEATQRRELRARELELKREKAIQYQVDLMVSAREAIKNLNVQNQATVIAELLAVVPAKVVKSTLISHWEKHAVKEIKLYVKNSKNVANIEGSKSFDREIALEQIKEDMPLIYKLFSEVCECKL